ncbi:hypothetical protein ACJIZ3_011542 [Penstemon smallii]|uniref:Transmembrane protein n=1 Tax=Penstemon smallii TaxID=265156 RepID=A0ABD3UKU8_9LAMI
MEYKKLEENELVDIESGESSNGGNTRRKNKSLNKLVSGALGFSESDDICEAKGNDNIELLVDTKNGERKDQELVPLVVTDHEKDKLRAEKAKKASKPPRPPRGPFMDAADMRVVREIYKIATQKRERVERMRELKKIKAAKSSSSSSSPPPSPPSSSSSSPPSLPPSSSATASSGATISIMVITFLFVLVIIFQGLDFSNSSNMKFAGAPQPAQQS